MKKFLSSVKNYVTEDTFKYLEKDPKIFHFMGYFSKKFAMSEIEDFLYDVYGFEFDKNYFEMLKKGDMCNICVGLDYNFKTPLKKNFGIAIFEFKNNKIIKSIPLDISYIKFKEEKLCGQ